MSNKQVGADQYDQLRYGFGRELHNLRESWRQRSERFDRKIERIKQRQAPRRNLIPQPKRGIR